ncbi:hypothetical protein L9F63_027128, partial [Diploptera punctata]
SNSIPNRGAARSLYLYVKRKQEKKIVCFILLMQRGYFGGKMYNSLSVCHSILHT